MSLFAWYTLEPCSRQGSHEYNARSEMNHQSLLPPRETPSLMLREYNAARTSEMNQSLLFERHHAICREETTSVLDTEEVQVALLCS
jgi:hypothetical protein